MKRLRLLALVILGLVALQTAVLGHASAINVFPGAVCNSKNDSSQKTVVCQQQDKQAGSKDNPIITDLRITIVILSYVIGVSAVIVIIIAGINMVTANGDSNAFGKARNMVLYSLIALLIVGAAQLIVAFVLTKL